jgi:Mg/Co/Ni transporter MgtE
VKPFIVTSGTAITKVVEKIGASTEQTTFPVIDPQNREYLGYIQRDDLKRYTDVSTCGEVLARVDPNHISKSIHADPGESGGELLKRSLRHKLDVLAVVDREGKYTGVLDVNELVQLF